jgi:DNA mismatch endonuclease (patch repair protein)
VKPKQNAAFWRKKIAANKARDRLVNRTLHARGWRVLRIWEHELTKKNERRCVGRISRALSLRHGAR